MSNIKNIFDDRRRRERETRVTYSKYIFNSHLVMFLIIVLGAGLINYSQWLENASKLEMKTVFIAASAIFSYLLVSLKVKTFIKEADAIFLLPLEKYYGKVAIKTGIILTTIHLLFLVIFYFIIKPLLSRIGGFSGLEEFTGIVGAQFFMLIVGVMVNVFYRLAEAIYFEKKFFMKVLLFMNIFVTILEVFGKYNYLEYVTLVVSIIMLIIIFKNYSNAKKALSLNDGIGYSLKWNDAAEYDKHREENYLKFVSMFVDVPLNGIKVARRKYFDILLPKLTEKNFTVENSFKYYYYRVFLRQENTVFLALRLMLIAGIIVYSFNNVYVSLVVIISYSYLTIIQLVPLYKQISNNIWHSILPVNEEIKIKSFKNLLTAVILITTFILTLLSIVVSGIDYLIIGINILSFVLANLLARVFIAKVK